MHYFSRLSDIVTCNLSAVLQQSDDPAAALQQIIAEMEEGLSGAKRSVSTAESSRQRIQADLEEQRAQTQSWVEKAKQALANSDENAARLPLIRKHEAEDVAAGLEQQLQAANSTVEHLATTQRALEGRLAEAKRRTIATGTEQDQESATVSSSGTLPHLNPDMAGRIDAELEAMRRELQ